MRMQRVRRLRQNRLIISAIISCTGIASAERRIVLRFSDSCPHAAESSPCSDHGYDWTRNELQYGPESMDECVNTCGGVCEAENNVVMEVIVEMKERGNSQSDKEGHNHNVTKSTMHAPNPFTLEV